jgi:hypothetical protein
MNKASDLKGLQYQGIGYLLYRDEATPRLTKDEILRKVGRHLGKRVVHICTTSHKGHRDTVLQYEHLFNKDVKRATKKLETKYNKK